MARSRFLSIILKAGCIGLSLAVGLLPAAGRACGPFAADAVFAYDRHPDLPLQPYAAGRLGILRQEYARSYLVVAHRYLSGTPLLPSEQAGAMGLWSLRLTQGWLSGPEAPEGSPETWIAARQTVSGAGEAPSIQTYREVEGAEYYVTYGNCLADAFATATRTLADRAVRYGASGPALKDWLAAQDTVFANCGEGGVLPASAPANADALARADRAYQVAAAHFYAGQFDAALAGFQAIAADPASPWRTLAPHLVARTLIRKATLGEPAGQVNKPLLAEAETRLRAILADPAFSATQPASERLLGFIRFRAEPDKRRLELATRLGQRREGADFRQALDDYTRLLDVLVGDPYADTIPLPRDDVDGLTDWVLTFQSDDPAAADRAVERWQKSGGMPWLVAAIAKVGHTHAAAPDLLAASTRIGPENAAFATVAYHAARLLRARGDVEGARARLDRALALRAELPRGTVNRLQGERLELAASTEVFVRDLERVPVGIVFDVDGTQLPEGIEGDPVTDAPKEALTRAIDFETAALIDRTLPLALRQRLSGEAALSEPLRRNLALSAWTRAVVLGDEAASLTAAEQASALTPELRDALKAYAAAPGNERKFVAILTILRHPGLRPFLDWGVGRQTPLAEIDDYRDNWWCQGGNMPADEEATVPPPAFLSAADREAAKRQWLAVSAIPTGPNYLTAQVLSFAESNPNDPRVPEALHLAVRSTRYGCTDEETSSFSKRAFQLLHRRYPKSTWAAETKYHY